MVDVCTLTDKHCVPCQGGVPALSEKEVNTLLAQLSTYWQINDLGHLCKRYIFKNFMDAIALANKIAIIAEQEGHHPDLTISWGSCMVEIWTHKINGLSESDFILAAKIEEIDTQ
ncbi:MAG: 4a-hydroxytetrahydrobiopterin dehydratase [Legionellaceae bacterium]|nr:4a-hydroxytetrahydrobiopterin dehydratase [Legionellaceae bacterium]